MLKICVRFRVINSGLFLRFSIYLILFYNKLNKLHYSPNIYICIKYAI